MRLGWRIAAGRTRIPFPTNRAGSAMRGILDSAVYLASAPLRLFGRSRRFRLIVGALAIVAVFFTVTLWALDRFFPTDNKNTEAKRAVASLPALPALQPVSRSSYVIAPVDGTEPDQLMKNADLALYASKADGGRKYRFFKKQMEARRQKRAALAAA